MKYFLTSLQLAVVTLLFTLVTQAQTIFRDDFNRTTLGSNWINGPGWSIVDGKAYNFYDGAGGTLNSSQGFSQTAYVIETHAYDFRNGYYREYGIMFGKPNPNQDYGYILKYTPYFESRLTLGRSEGNEFYPVALDSSDIQLDVTKQYTFRIEHAATGLIKVFLNDGSGYTSQPILQATDTTYPALGHFGWRVDTQTFAEPFYVDWIEARVLAAPALITNVSVANGKTYTVATLATGVTHYTDRTYTFTSLPPYLTGAAFIKTANVDKTNTSASFLTFTLTKEAHVYVFYDPRATALPAWLQGWAKLPDLVGTTDPGSSTMQVYTRTYPAGTTTLGANLASPAAGSNMNYLVAAIPTMPDLKLEAENAILVGPQVSNANSGYSGTGFADYLHASNDSIVWNFTVPAAGYYQLGFRYALDSGSRPLLVRVNGAVAAASLPFPATGLWSTWRVATTGAVLKAGTNTVTLLSIGSNGANIDYLVVGAGSTITPAATAHRSSFENLSENDGVNQLSSFPNPTRAGNTVRYYVPESGYVNVVLYNAFGKQVATVIPNEWQQAGWHQKNSPVSHLPNGVYFYRLQNGKTTQVTKLVIEK
jgi:hypothetical protein